MPTSERDFASLKELDTPFGEGIGNPDRLEWIGTYTHYCYMVEVWDTHESDGRMSGYTKHAYRLCFLDRERVRELSGDDGPSAGSFAMQNGEELSTLSVWEIVFSGEDFSPGAAQGDEELTLANLLGFLSNKPGDVEDDFFKDYTPRQLEFAKEHGEELALWSAELEGELD